LDLLQQCPWPGNVRELQQTLTRAAFWGDGELIDADHIRQALELEAWPPSAARQTLAATSANHVRDVVAACAGDTRRAAELLGISRRHVYRLLRTTPGTARGAYQTRDAISDGTP
jgi:DNA-binding NtrC family response regulator